MKLLSGGLYWTLIQKVIWKFRCKKRRKVVSTEMDYDEFVEGQAANNFDYKPGIFGDQGNPIPVPIR
jgi:hypothetical protein